MGQDKCAVEAAFGKSDPSPAVCGPRPPETVHGTSSYCLSAPQADGSCSLVRPCLLDASGPAGVPHWLFLTMLVAAVVLVTSGPSGLLPFGLFTQAFGAGNSLHFMVQ